jgi:hypothetical protein
MMIFRAMMVVIGWKSLLYAGEFTENRGKMRLKFVVNRGYIGGSLRRITESCWDMSVVDSILFVVATCLLLIRFCSLLQHVCC